jgi:antitoxin HicB
MPIMSFLVILNAGDDGMTVAECPALPGCVSQGATRAEAITNIQDMIRGILDTRRAHGLPIPQHTLVEVEVPDA